jgi:hypothetical protein
MLRCLGSPPMTTTAARTRLWTYADYCRIPPDRKRHEIIDGRHFVNPAPSSLVQRSASRPYRTSGASESLSAWGS